MQYTFKHRKQSTKQGSKVEREGNDGGRFKHDHYEEHRTAQASSHRRKKTRRGYQSYTLDLYTSVCNQIEAYKSLFIKELINNIK